MCIIFYNEEGVRYSEDELRSAWMTNSDGVGVMWLDEGKVNVFCGMLTLPETLELMKEFDGVPHALHLRFATHGPKVAELCHPFRASPEGADKEVWLMHNGVISDLNVPFDKSDTQVFAEQLQEMCSEAGTTDILFEEETIEMLEKQIGSYNKVVLLRGDGEVAILHAGAFYIDQETGIWYSNRYSVQSASAYSAYAGSSGETSSSLVPNSEWANIVDQLEEEEEDGEWFDLTPDGDWIMPEERSRDDMDGPLLLSTGDEQEDDSEAYEAWIAKVYGTVGA